jgi:hypothetical protein
MGNITSVEAEGADLLIVTSERMSDSEDRDALEESTASM